MATYKNKESFALFSVKTKETKDSLLDISTIDKSDYFVLTNLNRNSILAQRIV